MPGTTPAPAGVTFAGSVTAGCEFMGFVSIDEGTAFYDTRLNTKTDIRVGLLKGFTNTGSVEVVTEREGFGQSRQLRIAYQAEQYEETQRPKPYMSYHLEFPNEILNDATYDIFTIEHCQTRTATSGMPNYNNHSTIIAVVSYEDPTTPYYQLAGVGNPNPQKTYVRAMLNRFNTIFNLGNAAV